MRLFPMDTPAEIHRWIDVGAKRSKASDITVAKGPLVIMAYGLMAIDPAERASCWIHSPLGDLSPEEVADALKSWSAAH